MAKKQFKSESKRILDLMINSIYTHKEIFLRELISNASDAIDKLYFKSLTDDKVGMKREDFAIDLRADKAARTLTVSDNGIGMTADELEHNLGTIAHSGSQEFAAQNETGKDIDIIGRFGVGFYSAFMVADTIEVTTRAYGSDTAYKWTSRGADGYTIEPAEKERPGTDIVLTLKQSTKDEDYDEFLDSRRLQALVKRYSDYIRYPIRMDVEKQRKKEGTESEYESYTENEVLNSMVPLWRRDKKSITKEEYESFYREKFMAWDAPLAVIHQHGEGTTEYRALLYIPEKADYNFYTKEFEPGLQLYSRGVLIMDRCADVLPECFNFVKGLVDSEDLTLNISRETLQHDRQVAVIKKALERRIRKELLDMQKERRADYDKFFKAFGLQLKFSLYKSFGGERELLEGLLEYYSAKENRMMTLAEYRAAMPEAQKYVYYAAADRDNRPVNRAAAETVLAHGYDILYLSDDVDEFLMGILRDYDKKEFRSVSNGDLGLLSDEEKAQNAEKSEQYKDLFEHMKEHLAGKVSSVRLSERLGGHPVCLASEGAISIEMEKALGAMPGGGDVKADKVLELDASHPAFAALAAHWPDGKPTVDSYTDLLYDQALLLEGLPLDDPMAFSAAVCGLMK
ncbi:MAG: molecular chaperone HtpG [Oscillospiraceae bacterium]|nr:molecular chaperone HtpG [Oscillospiraceae bacterium]